MSSITARIGLESARIRNDCSAACDRGRPIGGFDAITSSRTVVPVAINEPVANDPASTFRRCADSSGLVNANNFLHVQVVRACDASLRTWPIATPDSNVARINEMRAAIAGDRGMQGHPLPQLDDGEQEDLGVFSHITRGYAPCPQVSAATERRLNEEDTWVEPRLESDRRLPIHRHN
jgi:hypothetical protein